MTNTVKSVSTFQTARTERSSNFELLRIIAMLMIVASHAAQHSGNGEWTLMIQPLSANGVATYLLGTYGQLGVILFVIISSWFLCDAHSIHIGKSVRLYLQTMLCSVAIFAFIKIGGFEPVGLKELLKAFLTPVYSGYWFIRTYLLFYLIVPFLQKYVQSADEQTHKKLLMLLTVLLPVLRFFLFVEGEFGNVGDFVYVFVAVSYLKKHGGNYLERHCRLVCAVLFAVLWSSLIAANIVSHTFGFTDERAKHYIHHIFACRHIFVMLLAMSLFYIFKNYVNIGHSKVINAVAKTTFGVYIFHENPLLHSYGEHGLSETSLLFEQWLHIGEHFYTDAFYPLYFIACVFGVFAACSLLEFARQILCRNSECVYKKISQHFR